MSMVGSLGDGDFHLEIRNVSLDDEETYQASWEIKLMELHNESFPCSANFLPPPRKSLPSCPGGPGSTSSASLLLQPTAYINS
jgi:hypothetical protein